MQSWKATTEDEKVLASSDKPGEEARVVLGRIFEFRVPLTWLLAAPVEIEKVRGPKSSEVLATHLRLRFSVWRNHLPVDALPVDGWIDLELLAEGDLLALAF